MPSIFSKILSKELPCHRLLENEKFLAFLDIRPISEGHALVIPKVEVDKFFDVSDLYLSAMLPFAKQVAVAIEKTVSCNRVGLMVAGLEVPHAHLHLVPINTTSDLSFNHAKVVSEEALAQLAESIRGHLQ